MTVLPKAIHRFNAITINLPMAFSQNYNKKINLYETQKILNSQNNLEKKKMEQEEWDFLILDYTTKLP